MPNATGAALVFEREFLPLRGKLLEVAASLDRIAGRREPGRSAERPTPPQPGSPLFRTDGRPDRANSNDLLPSLRSQLADLTMRFFDPHIHIASRNTDDLELMAKMGCVVVGEPAFWMGFDRSGVNSFHDYFRQLTEWEPKRGGRYRHPALLLARHQRQGGRERRLLPRGDRPDSRVPRRPDVLGIGEIGLNKNTSNEVATPGSPDRLWRCRPTNRCCSTPRTWKTNTRERG